MPKLTAVSVEKHRARKTRREIPDAACPGLYLVVQTSGAKSFAMRFRNQYGRHVKLTLGRLDVTGIESSHRADDRHAADTARRTAAGHGRESGTRHGQRCRRPASPPAAGTQGRSGERLCDKPRWISPSNICGARHDAGRQRRVCWASRSAATER